MAATARDRIEMRVSPEVKNLAERASAAMGCTSFTEFMTRLIREHAAGILAKQTTIELTNAQFDNFLAVCNDQTLKPSKSLMDAALIKEYLKKKGEQPNRRKFGVNK